MNWLANKQTRLKNKSLVTLSIEIYLDGDAEYFPWTVEGFKAAYKIREDNIKEIRNNDDYWISIIADDGGDDGSERITRKELSQTDWYKYYQFEMGKYNK
jgi:hypothetical protein|tara:strand:+ start:1655 stop:1954 length:300 start_codon:yes stop_codon:yes gene_type:complete